MALDTKVETFRPRIPSSGRFSTVTSVLNRLSVMHWTTELLSMFYTFENALINRICD